MRRSLRCRRSAIAVVAAAVLAMCLGGAAGSQATAAFDGAQLTVDSGSTFDGGSFLYVDVALQSEAAGGGAPALAARIDVATPVGYGLDLSAPPGRTVGQLIGVLVTTDGSDSDLALGPVVADDPATWSADPVAQACVPGPHAAIWRASPTVLGQTVHFPIAVDAVTGATPAETTYVMRICPTHAPSPTFPHGLALESMGLSLANIATSPTAPGSYRWSALVTPAAPGSLGPDPASAFELRAVERRPTLLTLHARFEAKTHTAAITGKLEAAGAPWAGADVSFTSQGGGIAAPTVLGSVPTAADGSFSLRIPAFHSQTIYARVSVKSHACSAASSAPGGCLSETDSAPAYAYANVLVPRDTDPHQALRPHDQALALSSILKPADVPGGQDVGAGPLPCEGFAPDLHRLTETGAAASDAILSGDQRSAAVASASVLKTAEQARTDFKGVAQLAALRCEVHDLTAEEPDDKVLGVGPLSIPRVGNESRAFRAQVSDPLSGRLTIDLLFVRAGRVVITLRIYSIGSPNRPLDLQLAHTLAARAARG